MTQGCRHRRQKLWRKRRRRDGGRRSRSNCAVGGRSLVAPRCVCPLGRKGDRTEWVVQGGQWKHVSLRLTAASAGGTISTERPVANVILVLGFPAAGIWQLFSRVYRRWRRVCAALTGGAPCRPGTRRIDIPSLSGPLWSTSWPRAVRSAGDSRPTEISLEMTDATFFLRFFSDRAGAPK